MNSRGNITMQKFAIFVKKKYHNVTDDCHYTGEYRDATHSICNLKCNVPKEISIVFQNGSNCNYHFIIKRVSRSTLKNTKKTLPFQFQYKMKLKELIKMERKSKKPCPIDYNLLIV